MAHALAVILGIYSTMLTIPYESFCILMFPTTLSDREGQGHWAVVYKSHFPATKAFFSKWHQCIHRLINHVYTKDQDPCNSLPHDMVAAQIKMLRSQEY